MIFMHLKILNDYEYINNIYFFKLKKDIGMHRVYVYSMIKYSFSLRKIN